MTVSAEGLDESRETTLCGDDQTKENDSFLPMVLTPENVNEGMCVTLYTKIIGILTPV